MDPNIFLQKLADEIDIEEDETIDFDTNLHDLENFDSLAIMGLVSLAHKISGRKIEASELQNVTTVRSLMKLIGEEHFA